MCSHADVILADPHPSRGGSANIMGVCFDFSAGLAHQEPPQADQIPDCELAISVQFGRNSVHRRIRTGQMLAQPHQIQNVKMYIT